MEFDVEPVRQVPGQKWASENQQVSCRDSEMANNVNMVILSYFI